MPTEFPDDLNSADGPAPGGFPSLSDPEAARAASLRSTLARVRRMRRIRRAVDTGVASLIIGTALWLAFGIRPSGPGAGRAGYGITATLPVPAPTPTPMASESVILNTPPNAAVPRITPVSTPGLRIRSQPSPDLMVRTSPESGGFITRLDNNEFHQVLARNGVCLIRIGNQWPRVLPLPSAP